MSDSQWVFATLGLIALVVLVLFVVSVVRSARRGSGLRGFVHPTDRLRAEAAIDLERNRAANKYPMA